MIDYCNFIFFNFFLDIKTTNQNTKGVKRIKEINKIFDK